MSKITAEQYASALHDQLLETTPKERDQLISDFVETVKQHKDESQIQDIIAQFVQIQTRHENATELTLVSSIPLHNIYFLSKKISEELKVDVEVKNLINTDIIGGIILYYKDYKVDFSVKNLLKPNRQESESGNDHSRSELKKIVEVIRKNEDLLFSDEKKIPKNESVEIVTLTAKERPNITVLEKQLSAVLHKKVIILFDQDSDIIAGTVIEYDHNKIDNTLKSKVKK